MRMFDIMLFCAILGTVGGAINGIMIASDENWFSDYNAPDMSTVDVSTDERYNMNDLMSDEDEFKPDRPSTFKMLFGLVEGIFLLTVVISKIFYPGYAYLSRPLSGFFVIVQVGIWISYIWGMAQILTGRNTKGME